MKTTTIHKPILVLNADYQPISVINWKRAIKLWCKDKVEIIEEYADEDVRSVNFTMKLPSVIRLLSYVKSINRRKIRFSRDRLYSRDKYSCQYCNAQPGIKALTLDHVVPRSHGGKTCWENIVAACRQCNSKKANKSLEQVGFVLKSKPREPSVIEFMSFHFMLPQTPDAWKNYLYWTNSCGLN